MPLLTPLLISDCKELVTMPFAPPKSILISRWRSVNPPIILIVGKYIPRVARILSYAASSRCRSPRIALLFSSIALRATLKLISCCAKLRCDAMHTDTRVKSSRLIAQVFPLALSNIAHKLPHLPINIGSTIWHITCEVLSRHTNYKNC